MPKAGNLTMDYASLIQFISPEASAYSRASDYVDVDSSLTAPVVANSPATELINRVANRSFDTSGVPRAFFMTLTPTRRLPFQLTPTRCTDTMTLLLTLKLHMISFAGLLSLRLEWKQTTSWILKMRSYDFVRKITTRILDIEIARLAKNRYCIAVQLYTIHKRPPSWSVRMGLVRERGN